MDAPYEAVECTAKLKFPYSKTDILLAFAIELTGIHYPESAGKFVEINALRPDPRDYKEFIVESMSYSGTKVIILLETVKYTDMYVKNPKYIIYNGVLFRNIR